MIAAAVLRHPEDICKDLQEFLRGIEITGITEVEVSVCHGLTITAAFGKEGRLITIELEPKTANMFVWPERENQVT